MAALETTDFTCSAEELVDAQLTSRKETLDIIHSLTLNFLQAVVQGDDPELSLVNISSKFLYNYCPFRQVALRRMC